DPILEWSDDLAPGRVVLGIGGESEQYVEWQPHRIPFDLDVAFLHDIEQSHLHLAAQIGQLVDGKDSPVGPGQQAEVHGQLIREQMPAAGRLDWIYVANQVRD